MGGESISRASPLTHSLQANRDERFDSPEPENEHTLHGDPALSLPPRVPDHPLTLAARAARPEHPTERRRAVRCGPSGRAPTRSSWAGAP